MKLIITEKPDVARKFREALEPSAKAVKYAERVYYYEGDHFVFVSALGHLFRAKYKEGDPFCSKQKQLH